MIDELESVVAGFWSQNKQMVLNIINGRKIYSKMMTNEDVRAMNTCSMLMRCSRMQNGPVKLIKHGKLEKY